MAYDVDSVKVMSGELDLDTLMQLAGHRSPADVPCPLCGPVKNERHKQRKPVLRIWRTDDDFASYSCARCGAKGYAHSGRPGRQRFDSAELARRMREVEAHHEAEAAKRRDKARWLWGRSVPAIGTVVERYLAGRGITVCPTTLRFLPPRGDHAPAMLAAFGLPWESEPGRYGPAAVAGVHITRLRPDGSGKAPDAEGRSKVMVGPSAGWPLALVPPNDAGGLSIAEGIEDALSLAQATGLGAWAAGAAGRLPKLAPLIASLPYLESVTIAMDSDDAGRRNALVLARELRRRRGGSLDVVAIEFGEVAHEAA